MLSLKYIIHSDYIHFPPLFQRQHHTDFHAIYVSPECVSHILS